MRMSLSHKERAKSVPGIRNRGQPGPEVGNHVVRPRPVRLHSRQKEWYEMRQINSSYG